MAIGRANGKVLRQFRTRLKLHPYNQTQICNVEVTILKVTAVLFGATVFISFYSTTLRYHTVRYRYRTGTIGVEVPSGQIRVQDLRIRDLGLGLVVFRVICLPVCS